MVYSLVLFVLVRGEHVRQDRIGYLSTVADIVWVSVITIFTERGPSPFFLLHLFVISSVSVRWGLAGALPVTVILAVGYPLPEPGGEPLRQPATTSWSSTAPTCSARSTWSAAAI